MSAETITPLTIPAESVLRLGICHRQQHLHTPDESCVRGIAEPVVAAELRRLADTLTTRSAAAALKRRADVLDPPN